MSYVLWNPFLFAIFNVRFQMAVREFIREEVSESNRQTLLMNYYAKLRSLRSFPQDEDFDRNYFTTRSRKVVAVSLRPYNRCSLLYFVDYCNDTDNCRINGFVRKAKCTMVKIFNFIFRVCLNFHTSLDFCWYFVNLRISQGLVWR